MITNRNRVPHSCVRSAPAERREIERVGEASPPESGCQAPRLRTGKLPLAHPDSKHGPTYRKMRRLLWFQAWQLLCDILLPIPPVDLFCDCYAARRDLALAARNRNLPLKRGEEEGHAHVGLHLLFLGARNKSGSNAEKNGYQARSRK